MDKQISDSNKTLLENTFVLAQTKKLFSRFLEKSPLLSEAKRHAVNRKNGIYEEGYENLEISAEHIMALYKTASQEISSQNTSSPSSKEGQF